MKMPEPDKAVLARRDEAANLNRLAADVIASGNVGCATRIARFAGTPTAHTVELLDWATGGPPPAPFASATSDQRQREWIP